VCNSTAVASLVGLRRTMAIRQRRGAQCASKLWSDCSVEATATTVACIQSTLPGNIVLSTNPLSFAFVLFAIRIHVHWERVLDADVFVL
jgi:hypothetical protein